VIIETLATMLVAIGLLDAWVTWRIIGDGLSSSRQRAAQIALVWLLSMLGALIVLNLQRRNPENGSGRYREIPDAGDDLAYSRQSFKKLDDAIDGD
jgi:hypothetical protein